MLDGHAEVYWAPFVSEYVTFLPRHTIHFGRSRAICLSLLLHFGKLILCHILVPITTKYPETKSSPSIGLQSHLILVLTSYINNFELFIVINTIIVIINKYN